METLHIFYLKAVGLEPQLYAYTCNEAYAKVFKFTRPTLYCTKRKINDADWVEIKNTLSDADEITEQPLDTYIDGKRKKVKVILTNRELLKILQGEERIFAELSSYIPNRYLFTKDFRKALDTLFAKDVENFWGDAINIFPPDSPYGPKICYDPKFKIDQLGLFCRLFKDLLETDNFKK